MFKPLESKSLPKSRRRLAGLKYLTPNLDFGNGISIQGFALKIDLMQAKLDAHNALVTEFTEKVVASRDEIRKLDESLSETAERMLNTVAVLYGRNSKEYELAGGVKRVRTGKKKKVTPSSTALTEPGDDVLLNLPEIEVEKTTTNPRMNAKKKGSGKMAIG
jgi:hypothetical protein